MFCAYCRPHGTLHKDLGSSGVLWFTFSREMWAAYFREDTVFRKVTGSDQRSLEVVRQGLHVFCPKAMILKLAKNNTGQ